VTSAEEQDCSPADLEAPLTGKIPIQIINSGIGPIAPAAPRYGSQCCTKPLGATLEHIISEMLCNWSKLCNVPDPYNNALRVAIAVFVACGIGYGVVLPSEGLHVTYARQFSQASKWVSFEQLRAIQGCS
jgi:hypothetical protein